MANQDNTQLVQEGYATFSRGDIPGLLNMCTDDVVWITPGPPDQLPAAGMRHGRAEVAQFFSVLKDTEEVEQFEPREFIAQGDKVVALIKYRSRIKATGRTVDTELAHVFTLRDGKIAEFREFFDTAAAVAAFQGAAAAAH
jgi:ketosteroid isomerase-like protein